MQTISSSNGNPSASAAQIDANRANSQLSTGPRTQQGKAKSSLNAIKNGLTGSTVLLPGDDAALYERHASRFFAEFKPCGERETELVQSLTDAQWRINRIPALEMGIYALARVNFKDMFAQEEHAVREALIQVHAFITHQKEINSLSIQELRLRRNYQKDLAELKELQTLRAQREKISKTADPKMGHSAPSLLDSEIGFEFSSRAPQTFEPTLGPAFSDESCRTEPEL
jgi:hypothetical protein